MQHSPAPHSNPWLANRRNRPSARRSGSDGTESVWSSGDEIGGSPYEELPPPRFPPSKEQQDLEKQASLDSRHERQVSSQAPVDASHNSAPQDHLAPPQEKHSRSGSHDQGHRKQPPSQSPNGPGRPVAEHNTASGADDLVRNPNERTRTDNPPHSGGTGTHTISTSSQIPPEELTRRPPQHPALLPEYRYCYKDELVKPMRAHHCRICGTVSQLS